MASWGDWLAEKSQAASSVLAEGLQEFSSQLQADTTDVGAEVATKSSAEVHTRLL